MRNPSIRVRGSLSLAALLTCTLSLSVSLATASQARAQHDVGAAAQAYAAGERAHLAGNYREAARHFELAYDAAPSPQALRSAIRSRRLAGDHARAATLSLQAIQAYPADRATRDLAQEVLDATQPQLAQVEVSCGTPCLVLVDNVAESTREQSSWRFFVQPGPHTLSARYSTGTPPGQPLDATAGGSVRVVFEAPAPEPLEVVEPPPAEDPAPQPLAPPRVPDDDVPPPRDGLSPAVFWSSAAATAVVAGITAWSVADTFAANRDYEANPTREGYLDGQDRRRRTFALVGVAGALTVTTAVLGALTDFGDSDQDDTRASASVWAAPTGGGLSVRGAF